MKVLCRHNNEILRHVFTRAISFTASKMANDSASQEMGKSFPHFGTLAIHAGQEPEQWHSRAVVPPISMATTFKQDAPGVHRVRNNFNSVPLAPAVIYAMTTNLILCQTSVYLDSPRSLFRDSSIPALETQQEIALKRVSPLWKVQNMVRFFALSLVPKSCHVEHAFSRFGR